MSMQVVLAPLFGSDLDRAGLDAAARVAGRFAGHLRGLFVRVPPGDVVPYVGEQVSPDLIERLQRSAEAEQARLEQQARSQFETVTSGQGGGGSTSEWLEIEGEVAETVVRYGRLADLIVFAQGDDPDRRRRTSVIETVLLESGRPLLLVPAGWTEQVGHTVAIAWNGRSEAARAVHAALPILEAAARVHILTAVTHRTAFERSLELQGYLERHGISAERQKLGVGQVGENLARQAVALGCDLLVMGGYGRSRLTELVLGGVTRHIMTHLDRPVLLAH